MAPKFRVLIASMVASAVWMIAPTAHAAGCPFIALSDGCLYTNTGADTDDRFDGFPVTNVDGIPLWDFYQTLDPQDVGFPISQRFRLDGFLVQAFQKAILQWRPDSKSFQYVNTLDLLAERHPNVSLPFLPGTRNFGRAGRRVLWRAYGGSSFRSQPESGDQGRIPVKTELAGALWSSSQLRGVCRRRGRGFKSPEVGIRHLAD